VSVHGVTPVRVKRGSHLEVVLAGRLAAVAVELGLDLLVVPHRHGVDAVKASDERRL
jgi:hypothetical protein